MILTYFFPGSTWLDWLVINFLLFSPFFPLIHFFDWASSEKIVGRYGMTRRKKRNYNQTLPIYYVEFSAIRAPSGANPEAQVSFFIFDLHLSGEEGKGSFSRKVPSFIFTLGPPRTKRFAIFWIRVWFQIYYLKVRLFWRPFITINSTKGKI